MATLSVVIAAKNEAHQIRKCLEHIKWADEIIIIDNGSTDDTVKICKEYTKKVYSHNKQELIPYLQNLGIEKATKEWILILDADVIVPEKAKHEILQKIQNPKYTGHYLPHRMVAFGKEMQFALFCNILKLFRNNQTYFNAQSAHCTIKIKGKIGKLTNHLLHYAHPNIETFVRKMNLYTTQDAKKIVENGKGGLLNKKIKKVGIYNLVIEPLLYANYLYFNKKYYKDGLYGLLITVLMCFYLFLERAKILELRNKQ